MLKTILSASALGFLLVGFSTVEDANADHRWKRIYRAPLSVVFGHEPRYFEYDDDTQFYDDEDDVIYVPRRKRVAKAAFDPDEFEGMVDEETHFELQKPKARKANLSAAQKRKVAAITGKPAARPLAKPAVPKKSEPVKVARLEPKATAAPTPKTMAPKPVVEAALPKAALPKTEVAPTPAAKPRPKLVLEPEDVPAKQSRLTPIPEIEKAISCDQASGIVTGFGFSTVKPQLCVGKTYSFKAMRDGTQFEVFISSASGELTEVKRL